jgi:hypothetical protein
MAVRKATMKKQLTEAVSQANPGDRVHGTMVAVTGPSPWLIGLLGLVGQLIIKYYFVTVTDQAVLFHRLNRYTGRPRELAHAFPRTRFPGVSDVQLNPLWSWFRIVLPGESGPTRMNVARQWKPELEQLLPLLGGAPQQQFPQQQAYAAQQPPAPQYAQYAPPQQPVMQQAAPPQQPPVQQPAPQQQYPQQSGPYAPAAPQYGAPQPGNPYAN